MFGVWGRITCFRLDNRNTTYDLHLLLTVSLLQARQASSSPHFISSRLTSADSRLMAEERRPPLPSFNSQSSLGEEHDPFADRPQLAFHEPPPSAYASTASLPHEFGGVGHGGQYDDDETEKVPLTSGAGGLYPPG